MCNSINDTLFQGSLEVPNMLVTICMTVSVSVSVSVIVLAAMIVKCVRHVIYDQVYYQMNYLRVNRRQGDVLLSLREKPGFWKIH